MRLIMSADEWKRGRKEHIGLGSASKDTDVMNFQYGYYAAWPTLTR